MEKWKIKLNRATLFKKLPQEIRFLQKLKDFYLDKVNSLPKKFFFWIFIIAFFIFTLPFCLGGILAFYIFPRIETKPSWLKLVLIILILIVTFPVGIGWTENRLGMNTPPNLVISNPITEETKVKGVNTIEISGKVNPAGSTVKINNGIVTVTGDGNFTKEVSINKGKNEIDIVGKHGSGITEKTVVVYRELTEKELAEEKKLKEERKARAEKRRIAREKARKKAEQEAQAKKEIQTADQIAINQIKKVLKNSDISVKSIKAVKSDINKRLLLTYISKGEAVRETNSILSAYLEQVKRNWDIDGLVVLIGAGSEENPVTIGMWYCLKEWADDYKTGKISFKKVMEKVQGTIETF